VKNGFEKTKQQWRAVNQFRMCRICESGHKLGVKDTVHKRRYREEEAHDRTGCSDIKESAIGSHRRTNQNESAKRSYKIGEGNKKRIAGAQMMVAASKEVSEFVSEQNPEQRCGKRKSREETDRILIEERERTQQLIDGYGFIVRVGHSKLCSRDEASAQRKGKKHNRKNQRLSGRPRRNLRVIPLADELVIPIQASRRRRGRRFW